MGVTANFLHPSLLLLFLDPGSEIRDPGWVKNQDPGTTSRIRNTEFFIKKIKNFFQALSFSQFMIIKTPSIRMGIGLKCKA